MKYHYFRRTATDFRALSQRANLLNLSEAAKIAKVKPQTIKRIFANDGTKPSLGMLENVHEYYDKIIDHAALYAAEVENQFNMYSKDDAPDEIALVTYKYPDYQTRFDEKNYTILPFASSHFLCMQIALEYLIKKIDCSVMLVTLAPDLYAQWLGDFKDTPLNRSKWAGSKGLQREMWVDEN